ncbi:MAG: hypothetical protein AAGF48_13060 [Pseudomonadota bacterium]
MTRKPILCLDFDGVIHSYTSGWKGADVIPDPPVDGAIEFIVKALGSFNVAVFSSRSNQPGGIDAMQRWLAHHFLEYEGEPSADFLAFVRTEIQWPTEKPPALVTIDDRAICFDGNWPSIETLQNFKPWNKRP